MKPISREQRFPIVAWISIGIALNLSIGGAIALVKLPLYLDSIGTILVAARVRLSAGILVGLVSTILGSVFTPTLWAYGFTATAIALTARWLHGVGFLKTTIHTALGGLLIGLVSAITAAPVTALLFGGVSLAGTDAITALLIASGRNVLESTVLAGLSADPVDKMFSALIALAIVRRVPSKYLPTS